MDRATENTSSRPFAAFDEQKDLLMEALYARMDVPWAKLGMNGGKSGKAPSSDDAYGGSQSA